MTVKELKKLLKGLPNDMLIVLEVEEDIFKTICSLNSRVAEVEIVNEDEEITGVELLLLLEPCNCNEDECELEIGDINSQPELN